MRIDALPSIGAVEMKQLKQIEDMQANIAGAMNPTALKEGVSTLGPGAVFRSEFASHLNKAVTEVEGKMRAAEVEKLKVLSGETNNLHQATIASSEAGIAFSLMIEVRNKLVESYQELMRMQV
jgi:flagellar hook-basal body complex protein FliE